VRKYISYAIVFVVIYVLFFSGFFQVKYIEIVGNQAIDTTEIESLIWQSLDKNILLLFGRDNFWLLSVDYLLKNIATQYSFEDITITKKFPHTLRLQIIERLGRLVWQANDQYYVIDANGVITRQLAGTNLIEQADVPVVVDQANRVVTIGATVMSTELCASIIEAAEIYEQLITRPELSLDHFVVGEDQETLYKIITTSGLEIHLNDASSVQEQLGKLKRVLDSQSLKLAGISYINLRIKDQVIYK
jgi:cell division septal protein FtsQ